MLVALLFATDDADDSPATLAATLPFGAATLIEFQARLAISAGASQLIVVVGRMTPELLGAVNRIMKRGAAVDVVRSASEACEKLHPLARVLVMADGLVSTEGVVSAMAGEGGDALLVTSDANALEGLERVGADAIWAGIARLSVRRVAEVANLPNDYDFASTLLRVAAQGGAARVELSAGPARGGHGVEHSAVRLRQRSEALLAGHVSSRPAWFDRYLVAPLARRSLPGIVDRGISADALAAAATGMALLGLAAIGYGWQGWGPALGLGMVVAACFLLAMGMTLSWMREDKLRSRVQALIVAGAAALAVVALGVRDSIAEGTGSSALLALTTAGLGLLADRAAAAQRRRWWASAPSYPLLLVPFAATGHVFAGLCVVAGYAAITLVSAVELLRKSA
ncbi:MAG: hypothetical protein ACKVOB_06205 [Sphingomonas sp.]